jgi:dephospho-CoA kinase
MKIKLIIIGYGRHGKDTVCDILKKHYGYNFTSSSRFCAEKVVFPVLSKKYNYKTVDECYNDRHNHRKEWFDLIAEYNEQDLSRLGKLLFQEHDIYCGLRRKEELLALQKENVAKYTIWVDASDRLPPEPNDSCTVTKEMADCVIYNNGTLEELENSVHNLMKLLQST